MAYADFVVVTMNHPQMLSQLLTSINHSGMLFSNMVRVIVVNNGDPESVAYLKAHPFPQIELIQMPENVGWEKGLAAGLEHTTAPIVGLLNDDLCFLPLSGQMVSRMLSAFRDPAVGAIGPMSNYVMGAQSLFRTSAADTEKMVWEVPYLINFCCLVRRAALLEIGGVDTTFQNGGDDLDQSIRLRRAGYKLLLDRACFVYHHGSQTGVALHGAHWNSEAHLDPIQRHLIQKHGFLGWWNCVYGASVPYVVPSDFTTSPVGKEEDLMIPWIPTTGTVLEVGCGNLKLVPWSVGLDLVPAGESVAQIGSAASVATVKADLNVALPYADGTVQGVVAKHVIEHLVDTLGVLRDWHRTLVPGGRVIVTTPNEERVSGIAMNPEHVHTFTPESFRRLAEAAGFKTLTAVDTQNGISFLYVGERNGDA